MGISGKRRKNRRVRCSSDAVFAPTMTSIQLIGLNRDHIVSVEFETSLVKSFEVVDQDIRVNDYLHRDHSRRSFLW